MHPVSPDVPGWLQAGLGFAAMVAVFVGTLFGYIKGKQPSSAANDVAVVSATFADRATIEKHSAALERYADAVDRLDRTMHEFSEESRRVRQSVDANTDAQINMTRFLRGHSQ